VISYDAPSSTRCLPRPTRDLDEAKIVDSRV
jgi:hypothetical protein